ncbi:Thermospermine synthase ACAULIS5 [Glycine max]|nr:Thermospermine synthase ACAULIS5 [Glycine max]
MSPEKFDVILGNVPEPDESNSSSCVHLYTKSFYENVVKPKLKGQWSLCYSTQPSNTQAGPAGIFTHKAMFSPLYNTLKQASNEPINLDGEEFNNRIGERIKGELRYLDGPVIAASTVLNKTMKNSLSGVMFVAVLS